MGPHVRSHIPKLHNETVFLKENHHIVEITRSFLLSADVPSVFWGKTLVIAVYMTNIISTAQNSGLSPFEKLYEEVSECVLLRVFDLLVLFSNLRLSNTKLYAKSFCVFFLDYDVT